MRETLFSTDTMYKTFTFKCLRGTALNRQVNCYKLHCTNGATGQTHNYMYTLCEGMNLGELVKHTRCVLGTADPTKQSLQRLACSPCFLALHVRRTKRRVVEHGWQFGRHQHD
eukprot:scpid106764/ scgid32850/ 